MKYVSTGIAPKMISDSNLQPEPMQLIQTHTSEMESGGQDSCYVLIDRTALVHRPSQCVVQPFTVIFYIRTLES